MPMPLVTLSADEDENRGRLRQGSRSFYLAGWLVPPALLRAATAVYAFCRDADDAIDTLPHDAHEHAAAHAHALLVARLRAIYSGVPEPLACDRALCEVVQTYPLPQALLEALLEGFMWDASQRRYTTLAEVEDYAARVAGSVGAMMATLMGVHDPAVMTCACELGVAMQLTNIARDVGEDARMGRLYLPTQWLQEEGLDAAVWLRNPTFSPALARVVERLLARADVLYARAASGIACLPRRYRIGMQAARLLYRAIGTQIARQGYDSVSRRAVVARPRQILLLLRACAAPILRRSMLRAHVPQHLRFLVEAAVTAPALASCNTPLVSEGIAHMPHLTTNTSPAYATSGVPKAVM